VVVVLVANYRLGPLPLWRDVPGGQRFGTTLGNVTQHDRTTARALRLIPSHAVVSVTNSLGAHLSARRRVLSFPFLQDATWIAADETQPGYADRFAPLLPVFRRPLGAMFTGLVQALRPFGTQALNLYARFSPPGDQVVFAQPEIQAMFLDDITGRRQPLRAPASDIVLFTRP